MLIALEGIDGSGKSTAVKEVAALLERQGVDAVSIDKKLHGEVDEAVARRAGMLSELIWSGDDPKDEFGSRFWMLLIAAWYSSLERIQPAFRDHGDRIVLVDGWYYRNIAKAVIRDGLDPGWLEGLFAGATRPDLVVMLDVDPRVAFARGISFTDLELGRWDGFGGSAAESFTAYQGRIRDELLRMSIAYDWVRVAPDPAMSPGAIAELVLEGIRHAIGPR